MIPGLVELAIGLIEKIIPDPAAKAAAQLEVLKLQQTGELAALAADSNIAQAQIEVNKVEAASSSFFVSGWRPAVGWVCVSAYAAKFIGGPALFVAAQFTSHVIVLPPIDFSEMLPILGAMLGIGGFRTYEKIKGVAS